MLVEKIGTNAGIIWNILNEKGEMEVKTLKKAAKLTEKDLNMALGWLAREAKIQFNEQENELFVSLI